MRLSYWLEIVDKPALFLGIISVDNMSSILLIPEYSDYELACSVQTFTRELYEYGALNSHFLRRPCLIIKNIVS